MDALQVEACPECGEEGRNRQKSDREGIGTDVLEELPRHQRAQRNPEQHQHGLRQSRRHGKRPSHHDGDADRHHRARNQAARQPYQKKQNAADRADRERFKDLKGPGAAGKSMRHRCKGSAHAALWQIRLQRANAPTRVQQCTLKKPAPMRSRSCMSGR